MELPDLSRNPALWLGLRQAESLRDVLKLTLNGRPPDRRGVRAWLCSQNVEFNNDLPDDPLIHDALTSGFARGFGTHPDVLVRGSNAPTPEWVNLGAERSGASWDDHASFIITSAFVRLLGAWEQFELDVLKALFNYRPLGLLGQNADQAIEEVEPDVIREMPRKDKDGDKEIYCKPPVWTWLRKHAENNHERAKIFKNVFGIEPIPDPRKQGNMNRDAWYEKRNMIAHGRAGVKMDLKDYIEVDVFVAKTMMHISRQCLEKLKLRV